VQELKCKECGQKFTSPSELQDHDERTHGGSKMGGVPVNEDQRAPEPRR
jgi:hypothetical protein